MTREIGLIPGTGKQSSGIALRLGQAGYKVNIGSRSKDKAEKVAEELNEKLGEELYTGYQNKEVVQKSNLLFLVVPPEYLADTLADIKEDFQDGTIIVDVIVPLAFEAGLAKCKEDLISKEMKNKSVSEFIQSSVPNGITVIGAFKTISAAKLNKISSPLDVDVFLTSDEIEAKVELKEILTEINGLRVLDAGPLAFSRTTEQMTALVITLNKLNKLKHASFKIISTN